MSKVIFEVPVTFIVLKSLFKIRARMFRSVSEFRFRMSIKVG